MSDRRPECAGKDDRVFEKPAVNLTPATSVVAASTAISWQAGSHRRGLMEERRAILIVTMPLADDLA